MAGRTASRSMFLAGGVLVALAAPARPACASDLDDFQACRAAYEAQEWPRAVACFEGLVGAEVPRLGSTSLVLESRKYLAASYFLVGRREAAAAQFERLLREDPSYELDASSFPVEIVELFAHTREQSLRELRLAEERAAEEARRAAEEARLRALLAWLEEDVQIAVENSRWLAALPFGVGQFERGETGLGAVFLTAEALLGLTAAITLGVHEYVLGLVGSGAVAPSRTAEVNQILLAMEATNWAAVGAFLAFASAGILEAQLNFQPTRVVRHRRALPPDLLDALHLSAGPGGLSLHLRF